MERSGKREGLLEKTAEVFDLPGDVVAGLPRIELTGSRELRMENHKGILSYGGEEIHISGGEGAGLRPGAAEHERQPAPDHRRHHGRGAGIGGAEAC